MRVCFIAAPLIARSGVYNSAIELVTAAREIGLPWTAALGVSSTAGGASAEVDGVTEFVAEPAGVGGIMRLRGALRATEAYADADLVVSLVPQSDMVLALERRRWIAYVRGLPWPERNEASLAKRTVWRWLERLALRRAEERWVTTEILARGLGGGVDRVVAPGIRMPQQRAAEGQQLGSDIVWAARYSSDKNPQLFIRTVHATGVPGAMYGSGPLEEELRVAASGNPRVPGWIAKDELWDNARAYVGTSTREAFGRSAVEAALHGIPLVLSDQFGCADMLFTDVGLRERHVLPLDEPAAWEAVVRRLSEDTAYAEAVGLHVQENARALSIGAAVDRVARALDAVG
ncbi:glycosyltransferase involved in cell wall biosynthesis [Agrococcus jenensis]|uniref:Glycosyltransferase involved in cell wall biosynthesis n=1 Tax=Agrococcus jenensis TaxID=46353 RepID=A0A3N2ATK6_9MICO|nr:glycosyltransferase involved in cell wall biosynthesis [Agrococcus jenensis]